MEDIVTRLRRWTHAADSAPASDLMDDAAAEIERLRLALARLADQNATFSVVGGNIIVDVDHTLTDAERRAIEYLMMGGCEGPEEVEVAVRETARRLLARTGQQTGHVPDSGKRNA